MFTIGYCNTRETDLLPRRKRVALKKKKKKEILETDRCLQVSLLMVHRKFGNFGKVRKFGNYEIKAD